MALRDGNHVETKVAAYLCTRQVVLGRCQCLGVLGELWRRQALGPKTKPGHHALFPLNQGCQVEIADLRYWDDKQNSDSRHGSWMQKVISLSPGKRNNEKEVRTLSP